MPKKTWQEKLQNNKDLPKIFKLEGKAKERFGKGTMVIPKPLDVHNIMKKVPEGKVITTQQIASKLAKKYKADMACPMCTGIFAWISAHAAAEQEAAGGEGIPYWRTVKSNGELNPKFPGGLAGLEERLKEEGHTFTSKGKKRLVADLEEHLYGK